MTLFPNFRLLPLPGFTPPIRRSGQAAGCLSVMVLLLACAPWAMSARETSETRLYEKEGLRLHCPPPYMNRVHGLIAEGEKSLDQHLPSVGRKTGDWLTVVVVDPDEKMPILAPMGAVVRLQTDFSAQQVVFACGRGLLGRRLEIDLAEDSRFNWLAAALAFDLLYVRTQDSLARPDYQFMLASLANEHVPTPADVAAISVSPEWPYAFRLYAAWSYSAVRILGANPANGMSALGFFVQLLLTGTSPADAWEGVWKKLPDPLQDSRIWFTRACRGLVRDTRQLEADREMEREIQDVLGVAVLTPGPDGRMKYRKVPIQELRNRFPDARLDNESLQIKEKRIFDLLKQAPLQLQKPLANYMGALQERKSGKSWNTFLGMLESADTELSSALNRYRGTCRLLDELESQYGRSASALPPCLVIAARHREVQRAYAPGISGFLDDFEL